MKFNEIPKFVINLERRPDRLEKVKKDRTDVKLDNSTLKSENSS